MVQNRVLCPLNVMTSNVRGLINPVKRRSIFCFLKIKIMKLISWVTNYSLILARNSALIYNFTCEIIKLPWQRFVPRWRSRFKDVRDEFTSTLSFNFVHFRLNFIWLSLLWPYNKLLVTIYSSKRVNTKTNKLMAAIGF